MVIAVLGFGITLFAGFNDDQQYNILKKETLILDSQYLKELKTNYQSFQRKSTKMTIGSICLIITGGLPFLFVRKDFLSATIAEPYYPICVFFIATGFYILIRIAMIIEGYSLLAENEKHTESLVYKFAKKLKKKFD